MTYTTAKILFSAMIIFAFSTNSYGMQKRFTAFAFPKQPVIGSKSKFDGLFNKKDDFFARLPKLATENSHDDESFKKVIQSKSDNATPVSKALLLKRAKAVDGQLKARRIKLSPGKKDYIDQILANISKTKEATGQNPKKLDFGSEVVAPTENATEHAVAPKKSPKGNDFKEKSSPSTSIQKPITSPTKRAFFSFRNSLLATGVVSLGILIAYKMKKNQKNQKQV